MTPRRRHGFTLLETILAVGLAALLLGLLGAGMRIYTRTVSQRRADVVNAQIARVVLNQIARDLRAAYVGAEDSSPAPTNVDLDDTTESDDTGTDTTDTTDEEVSDATADLEGTNVQPTPGLYGNQSQLQIDVLGRFAEPAKFDTLTAAGVDPQAGNLLSDPKVVTYFLRPIDSSELSGNAAAVAGRIGPADCPRATSCQSCRSSLRGPLWGDPVASRGTTGERPSGLPAVHVLRRF